VRPRAVVFDFNGTLSDDEPILCDVYQELFAEYGRPMTREQYFAQLAGLSEEEIFHRWLGEDFEPLQAAIAERIARFRARTADGSTVGPHVREAVAYAAARVPVAIVSGAAREEIEPILGAAGLTGHIRTLVPADDVTDGKPHPEGYLRALALLDGGVPAADVVAFEDTVPGVASARAAGLYVIGVRGTLAADRLSAADEVVPRIDVALMRRLLG
jgi:beta-phosphoglucomutase